MSTNKGLYTYDDFERKAQEYGFTADQISDADRRLAQTNADAGVALLGYKNDWLTADNDSAKAMAHAAAEDIRARYGNYTGGANGGSFTPTGTAEYEDPWETAVQAQIRSLEDRKFKWSPETDPTVKYYEDAYRREGERAMKDTLGAVAATTGGIPSSYATAAAAQQRNYYAQQLTDKYPELYQQAYENFLAEYDRDYQMLDAYSKLSDTEYGRWYDKQASDRQARQDAAAATQQAFENNMQLEELAIIKDEFELSLMKFDHEKQVAIKDDAYRWAALIQEGKIAEAEQEYRNSALALDEKKAAWDYAAQMADISYKYTALDRELDNEEKSRQNKLELALVEERMNQAQLDANASDREWEYALAAAEYGDFSKLRELGVDTTQYEQLYQQMIEEQLQQSEVSEEDVVGEMAEATQLAEAIKEGTFGKSGKRDPKNEDGTFNMNVLLAKEKEGRPLSDEEKAALAAYHKTIGHVN